MPSIGREVATLQARDALRRELTMVLQMIP
jgi:hypothetical protein